MAKEEAPKRARIRERVNKDLGKEIDTLLTDLHERAEGFADDQTFPITLTLAAFGSLLGKLSVEADIQTRRIVRLTWALVILTTALLSFTIYLAEDVYFNRQRDKAKQSDRGEPNQSDTEIHSTILY